MVEPDAEHAEVFDIRAKNTTTLVLVATFAWAGFLVLHIIGNHPLLATVCGGVAALTGGLYLWSRRNTRHWRRSLHVAAVFSVVALVAIAVFTGQSSSGAWWYLLLVPVFVGQALGWRAGLGWAVACALLAAGVVWSDELVRFPAEYVEGDIERSVGGITVAAFAIIVAMRATRMTEQALLRATDQKNRLAEQARLLEQQRLELALARDAADRASRFKTAFLADMSHELRTPLNGVLGMATLLAESELRPDQREMADAIRATGATLKHILDDILDITKTDEGRLELKHSPFRLRDCVVDAVDLFAAVAARKDIELAVLIDPPVPSMIVGDAARLGQVVRNLVGNAVKFTDKGEVVVSLRMSDDAAHAILEVRDTGPGISPDVQARMFDRFESGEAPFGTSHVGTGLGLWLCRKLLDLMGGGITVESEPGKGATFRSTFPVDFWEDTNDTKRSSLALTNSRILAVEDHPIAQEALRLFAREIGARLTVVETTEAALTLRAPQNDPWEVAIVSATAIADRLSDFVSALRASTGVQRLPVVLLTNPASVAKAHDQSVVGRFAAMTHKPVVASRLGPIIEHALFMGYSMPAPTPTAVRETSEYGLRTLVVEDDVVSRRVAELLLQRLGCTVETADGGVKALAAIKEKQFDLVFLDLVMPGMDGFEVAERMRREVQGEQLPYLVALTGSVFEADRLRARVAGMDDFLPKPLEVSALHEVLQRVRMRVARRARKTGPKTIRSIQHRLLGHVYDAEKLRELEELFGGSEAVKALLQDFVELTGKDATLVRQHMESGNWEGIRRIAHTTKSRAASMGATRLSSAAKDLEHAALEGDAGPLVARMLDEMNAVRVETQVL